MTLLAHLRETNKGMLDVMTWINEGFQIAIPIVSILDPPVGVILVAVEKGLEAIPKGKLNASQLQAMVTAMATVKSGICTGCCACSCGQQTLQTPKKVW